MNDSRHRARSGERHEPLTLVIAALGGQGGGVLTDWIGQAARADGFIVQATSTPGVSQRTGATTYYLELADPPRRHASPPVLALAPLPGRVDVLLCSELLEAARMLERGMSTPSRTMVIASTHRVYTTREKMDGGDGRFDSERIVDAIRALSRDAVLFDMEAVRARHGAAISAVLFGALAGSGALPLTLGACETAIRVTGKGVEASLDAFGEAFNHAVRRVAIAAVAAPAGATPPALERGLETATELPAVIVARIAALPTSVAEFARLGATRAAEYQNIGYAQRYLDRVERIVQAEAGAGNAPSHEVGREAARYLALWMCYEDLIRVASLKARASRLVRIRREVGADDGEVVRVYDFFKPSAHEIAAILPRGLGERIERRAFRKPLPTHAGKGITLQATSVIGALLLRFLAALRPMRPHSLRFVREQETIDDWLDAVEGALAIRPGADVNMALEIAQLPRLLKGYGDTHAHGRENFQRILQAFRDGGADLADALRAARDAALANCEGKTLDRRHGARGASSRAQTPAGQRSR